MPIKRQRLIYNKKGIDAFSKTLSSFTFIITARWTTILPTVGKDTAKESLYNSHFPTLDLSTSPEIKHLGALLFLVLSLFHADLGPFTSSHTTLQSALLNPTSHPAGVAAIN